MLYVNFQLEGIEWYRITMQKKDSKKFCKTSTFKKIVLTRIIYNGKNWN
jgi:hypothetical protein